MKVACHRTPDANNARHQRLSGRPTSRVVCDLRNQDWRVAQERRSRQFPDTSNRPSIIAHREPRGRHALRRVTKCSPRRPLNHPNIAAIHGLEESGGVRALVLEYVDGPTLADRLAAGPIALDDALPIARQIADALEAAHDHGVTHRDLEARERQAASGRDREGVGTSGWRRRLVRVQESQPATISPPTITSPARLRQGFGEAAH